LFVSIRLDGKIAIVTEGLSGIGVAIAQRMVGEGATVIAADLSSKGLPAAVPVSVPFLEQ
jgi:NAD(P)-dependent dehydrogenase (short-subunit alcohol dehydrogenase family)